MNKILKKEKIAEDIYLMQISAPEVASHMQPGQFVVLRTNEKGERIALQVADYDKKKILVVFEAKGKMNTELTKLRKGDNIKDLAGPLGLPSQIMDKKFVCFVASGSGIASIYPIALAYKKLGIRIHVILAGKNKKYIFWKDVYTKLAEKLIIATEDGSLGVKANVSSILSEIHKKHRYDLVYAIGSTVMMRLVSKYTYQRIKTLISINPVLVDGYGHYCACKVRYDGKLAFTCEEGPEFDAHMIDFEDIICKEDVKCQEESHIYNIINMKIPKKK